MSCPDCDHGINSHFIDEEPIDIFIQRCIYCECSKEIHSSQEVQH